MKVYLISSTYQELRQQFEKSDKNTWIACKDKTRALFNAYDSLVDFKN